MLFVMTCLDKPNAGTLRAETRPAHLDFIRARIGNVLLAGPILADDEKTPVGSMLIVDLPSRAELDRFAAEDPYAKAGLFQSVTVRPFRKVFPES
jgi:uncharacterized protein YciI